MKMRFLYISGVLMRTTKFATENGDLGCLSNLPEWPNLVKVLVSVTALRCLFINNLGII
jgi:hypothetical protein